jgi:hypothetical protein
MADYAFANPPYALHRGARSRYRRGVAYGPQSDLLVLRGFLVCDLCAQANVRSNVDINLSIGELRDGTKHSAKSPQKQAEQRYGREYRWQGQQDRPVGRDFTITVVRLQRNLSTEDDYRAIRERKDDQPRDKERPGQTSAASDAANGSANLRAWFEPKPADNPDHRLWPHASEPTSTAISRATCGFDGTLRSEWRRNIARIRSAQSFLSMAYWSQIFPASPT